MKHEILLRRDFFIISSQVWVYTRGAIAIYSYGRKMFLFLGNPY